MSTGVIVILCVLGYLLGMSVCVAAMTWGEDPTTMDFGDWIIPASASMIWPFYLVYLIVISPVLLLSRLRKP